MSNSLFALKRVDISTRNSDIVIPKGKTIVGRGPFLQCADKKVSRNHAELELTNDGCLYITSVHGNPCFLIVEGHCGEPLEKHKRHKLEVGDKFSLLSDSFTYEVLSATSAENNKCEEINVEQALESVPKYLERTYVAENSLDSGSEEGKEVQNKESIADMEEGNENISDKRRTLPSWLLAAASGDPEKSATNVKGRKRKNDKVTAKDSPPKSNRRKDISSDEDSENEDRTLAKTLTTNNTKDESSVIDRNSTLAASSPTGPSQKNTDSSNSVKNVEAEKDSRRPCEFGKKCYRKNPLHFKECSHPGDDDYHSDPSIDNSDDDDDDDRPECEFGTDCYRKNPQHIKQYRHTKRPKRKAAREAQKKASTQGRSEEGDESYDSSFINDDDSFDDSSYSPDEEELKTLQNEAKKFVRNKKLHKTTS